MLATSAAAGCGNGGVLKPATLQMGDALGRAGLPNVGALTGFAPIGLGPLWS